MLYSSIYRIHYGRLNINIQKTWMKPSVPNENKLVFLSLDQLLSMETQQLF